MADFLTNNIATWVSKRPETSLNTPYTAGADFLKALTTNPGFVLPQIEFVNDANKPGNGHEFPTKQCPTYVGHPAYTFTDEINVDYAGRLLLRALGGAVTAAQQGGTAAYKHSCKQLDALTSRQLPSSTMISEIGGASFRLDGLVVDRYRLSQNRADPPQFSVDLVGSGKHVRPHGVTSLPATAATLTCLNGNNTLVSWTDTVGAQNFHGSSCALRSWFVEVQNNTVLRDRCPGDSTVTITDVASSLSVDVAYVGKMRHGARQCTAQIVILLDSTIPDWLTFATNDTLTDVTFRPQGAIIASTFRYSLGIIMEKARVVSIDPVDSDGDAALAINLLGFWDSAASTSISAEVVNTETSNYD